MKKANFGNNPVTLELELFGGPVEDYREDVTKLCKALQLSIV